MALLRTALTAPAWLSLLLAGASGCGLYSHPDPAPVPAVDLPAEWSAADDGDVAGDWVRGLGDERLTGLVREGLRNSHDLRALAARVRAADAQAGAAAGPRWPALTLGLDGARSRRAVTVAGTTTSTVSESYEAGVEISWEADVWQRIANQAHAAAWSARSTAEDHAAARLALAGNISRTWFQAIAALQQRETLRETLANYRANLETVSDGVIAGINPVLDLRLLRAQAAAAESQLAASEGNLTNLILSLEVLLGRVPDATLVVGKTLPSPGATPAAGLPLQLLERRPDLRSVRSRLLAQEETALAARKNLLPSLVLGGSRGRSGARLADLTNPEFLAWNIAASLAQPVFSGGRLQAEREAALAEREARIAEYAAATVQAVREVESALHAEGWLQAQEQAQQDATRESVTAEQLAREQYAAGLVDIATLLEAQRRSLDARRSLIALRSQRLQNRVDLHLALGGAVPEPGEREPATP